MGTKIFIISLILFNFLPMLRCDRTAHLFDSIYQFGDSLTDTGNLIIDDPNTICSKHPHGIDLYKYPTGRCSNGLLMIDFYAKTFALPLLNPYKKEGADFSHGVNFAVGGATALAPSVLVDNNITHKLTTESSLSVQVDWFKQHIKSICSTTSECKDRLSKALILMGEFGRNDYNFPLLDGVDVHTLHHLVPLVIHSIKTSVQEIIDVGASLFVVPGDLPMGCTPRYLDIFESNETTMYDDLRCLKHLDEFSVFHNFHLQQALEELRRINPSVTIYYRDNYRSFARLLQNVASLGFEEDKVFIPCCGKKEDNYTCDESRQWCENPRKRVFWDGGHLTEEVYRILADWSITDMFNMKVEEFPMLH